MKRMKCTPGKVSQHSCDDPYQSIFGVRYEAMAALELSSGVFFANYYGV